MLSILTTAILLIVAVRESISLKSGAAIEAQPDATKA
jgi:hypothetical protein